jgi:cytochrome P450
MMNALADLVRLEDPRFYLDDPYPVMQRLRREEPVFFYEPLNMWVMSKYEDIRHVGRTPEIFSNHDGIHWSDFQFGGTTKQFFRAEAENIALLGPPRHNEIRRVISPALSAGAVARMRDQVRQICRDLLAPMEAGQTINWSRQVAEPLPLLVIAILIGFPIEQYDKLKFYSDQLIKIGLSLSREEIDETVESLKPMYLYFEELLNERDRHPTEDLTTSLQQARKAGDISTETAHMLMAGMLVAGNETTRNTINGAILLLAQNPDQFRLMVQQPDLAKSATEEFLRYVSPVRGFGRTVIQETEIKGKTLRPGQRVFNFFMSGNRDEDIFADAGTFDIAKPRDRANVAFGFGQHTCIGAALARMEISVLFEELVARFSDVTLEGTPFRDKVLQYNMWENVQTVFN